MLFLLIYYLLEAGGQNIQNWLKRTAGKRDRSSLADKDRGLKNCHCFLGMVLCKRVCPLY